MQSTQVGSSQQPSENVTAPASKKPASSTSANKSPAGDFLRGLMVSRRKLMMVVGGLVLAIGGMATLHAVDKQRRELHDLTVIGNGAPAIVQVHSPSCSVCRRLKSVTSSAMEDLPGVNFRLADITTPEGRAFGEKYNLPQTTLLLFNAEGEHRHTLRGLVSRDEITDAATRIFDAPS